MSRGGRGTRRRHRGSRNKGKGHADRCPLARFPSSRVPNDRLRTSFDLASRFSLQYSVHCSLSLSTSILTPTSRPSARPAPPLARNFGLARPASTLRPLSLVIKRSRPLPALQTKAADLLSHTLSPPTNGPHSSRQRSSRGFAADGSQSRLLELIISLVEVRFRSRAILGRSPFLRTRVQLLTSTPYRPTSAGSLGGPYSNSTEPGHLLRSPPPPRLPLRTRSSSSLPE